MLLKTLTHPDGRTFKMGRRRPVTLAPHLHLRNYLLRTLPTPPTSIDYTDRNSNPLLTNVLSNDNYGCCTCSGAFHIAGTLLANANTPPDLELNAATCLALYMQLTGGADEGLDENTVLHRWQTRGLLLPAGHKSRAPYNRHQIAGYVSVDPTDETAVKTALWLFENLYFGVELPDAWVNPMPAGDGFRWDLSGEADPKNGHCFVGLGYGPSGMLIDTWGMLGSVTWLAVSSYCNAAAGGQLFAVLSQDQIGRASAKAPNGFAWAQLQADLQAFN